jgi:hypothetical protein
MTRFRYTTEEHKAEILARAEPLLAKGIEPTVAITRAGDEWKAHLRAQWDQAIADALVPIRATWTGAKLPEVTADA